jgi:hypothetical protein
MCCGQDALNRVAALESSSKPVAATVLTPEADISGTFRISCISETLQRIQDTTHTAHTAPSDCVLTLAAGLRKDSDVSALGDRLSDLTSRVAELETKAHLVHSYSTLQFRPTNSLSCW